MMKIPDISSLMNQKIAEIQSRLPIKMNVPSSNKTGFARSWKMPRHFLNQPLH